MALLDRATIVEALDRLNRRLAAQGQKADLFLVGGAVMCLVHHARPANRVVDGWFTQPQAVRAAARDVMKCAAARTEEDTRDIRHLANVLGLRSADEILRVVLAYYPTERLPVRSRLLPEEMFGERD